MLTVKDRKSLENIDTVSNARVQTWMYFAPVFLTLTSAFNVWMASQWGQRLGYSLPALIRLFLAGTNPAQSYPGILLRAEDELQLALISFGAAILTLILATQQQKLRQFHLRMRVALKQTGAL